VCAADRRVSERSGSATLVDEVAPGQDDGVNSARGSNTTSEKGVRMTGEPVQFEVHESGAYLHGTKAVLEVGDLLTPGRGSNFQQGRITNFVYVTQTLDAATWGAELAAGEGRGRIYVVEPTGILEDDPNLTNKKFPGNPTRPFRTREPVRVVGELADWVGHAPEALRAMNEGLARRKAEGLDVIDD
jgi:rifampin ADP-ribosylating transferase